MRSSSHKVAVRVESDLSAPSSLVSRNITIFGRRTSVRLEPEMWMALNDIAERERCTVHDICSLVYVRKKKETSLTAAIRVFLMLYFRAAATEPGHMKAGHGNFDEMKRRARITEDVEVYFKKRALISVNKKGNNDNLYAL